MLHQYYPVSAHGFRYELNKDFHFAAAHFVPREEAGVCKNMHGHTYSVNVTVVGNELDGCGFLINFKELKRLVHDRFDHGIINDSELFDDFDGYSIPTTENMARVIYQLVSSKLNTLPHKPRCLQVIVRETPTSYVIYRPEEV